jgi:hypothetical protein
MDTAAIQLLNDVNTRNDFKATSQQTIQFVLTNLAKDTYQPLFFYFYKYSMLMFNRKSKIESMTSYDQAQHYRNLRPIFQKLIDHNQRCIEGARVSLVDAMNNYAKFQKTATNQQSTNQSQVKPSWFNRTFFGSNKNGDNVPPGVYLFMVAFTFALFQYEIMFNTRCHNLFNVYQQNMNVGNPSIVRVPLALSTYDKVFNKFFVTNVNQWLNSNRSINDISQFMNEIGINVLLDAQFKMVIDPVLQQRFEERQSQNPPMSTGGVRNKKTKTNMRARKRAIKTTKRHHHLII